MSYSLITRVPIPDSITAIRDLSQGIQSPNLLGLILTSTYFLFQGKFYQQTSSTPMSSLSSPIVADILTNLRYS